MTMFLLTPGILFIFGVIAPCVGWEKTVFAGERFFVGVGILQWLIFVSLFGGRLLLLLFPGVFVVVDFLFRRGLAGGRVSTKEKNNIIFLEINERKIEEWFVLSAEIK